MRGSSIVSPRNLALGFVAGALAVPIFHQGVFALLHAAGIIPVAPFDMTPTQPLGVPAVVSISFWGGVWGIVLVLVLARFRGAAWWIAAAVFGAVPLTLVYCFVVAPLKTGAVAQPLVPILVVGALLNAAWGLGAALFLRVFGAAKGGRRNSEYGR
jgi:hypothetical protein